MKKIGLSSSGNARWYTEHYQLDTGLTEDIVIPKLARCIGVLIFWTTRPQYKNPIYTVTALHIPPYEGKGIKRIKRKVIFRLQQEMIYSTPYLILIAGGKIDTVQNKAHYERSVKTWSNGFRARFPNATIHVYPTKQDVRLTTMVLRKKNLLVLERHIVC